VVGEMRLAVLAAIDACGVEVNVVRETHGVCLSWGKVSSEVLRCAGSLLILLPVGPDAGNAGLEGGGS
jgi:hypothetical protein